MEESKKSSSEPTLPEVPPEQQSTSAFSKNSNKNKFKTISSDELKSKIHSILINPKFSLSCFSAALIFCLISCGQMASMNGKDGKILELNNAVASAEQDNDSLQSENTNLTNQVEELEKEIDDLKNGAPRLLEQIEAAYKDKNWDSVVALYDQLHEKFAGSPQDKEASEKYVTPAKAEIQKKLDAQKAAEEEKKRKEEEEKKKKAEEEAKAKAAAEEAAKRSNSQKNAIKSAEHYLAYSAFSKQGLIEQLEFEGFAHEDAVYATDHITVDWNEQAYKSAKHYLEYSSFSEAELIRQLEFEGFTSEQATYGASKAYAE